MKGTDAVHVPAGEVHSMVQETMEARDSCLYLLIKLGGIIGCSHIHVEIGHLKAEGCRRLVSWVPCPWVYCGERKAKAAEHLAGTLDKGDHLRGPAPRATG